MLHCFDLPLYSLILLSVEVKLQCDLVVAGRAIRATNSFSAIDRALPANSKLSTQYVPSPEAGFNFFCGERVDRHHLLILPSNKFAGRSAIRCSIRLAVRSRSLSEEPSG